MVIVETANTASRISIGHTDAGVSSTPRPIAQIAGQTPLVHTLTDPLDRTVKIILAADAGIAIGARITNGRIAATAPVRS